MISIYYLGIDLGGTNIKAGVVNENHEILGRASLKTKSPRPAGAIAEDMAKAASVAVQNSGLKLSDIKSAGIGSPGMIDPKNGMIEFAGNLNFKNVPMAKMVSDILGLTVRIENDANAAAFGEFIAGAGKGCRNFIAITLGTGVGSGIIINGKLLEGHNNAAGEMGHTVIVADGEDCTCGRKGCFEAYASATALIRQTREIMLKHRESKMWELTGGSIHSVSGRTSFEAMRMGDEAGKMVVDRYIRYIACGVTNAINIFQPEVICIGGGICNEGDYLMGPLIQYVRREQFGGEMKNQPEICRAVLGNDAGIIGAAFLNHH